MARIARLAPDCTSALPEAQASRNFGTFTGTGCAAGACGLWLDLPQPEQINTAATRLPAIHIVVFIPAQSMQPAAGNAISFSTPHSLLSVAGCPA
jgi:hypothetical protein